MSSVTPFKPGAQRSRHLLPLMAIALIGCLGGCQYESAEVPLPSVSSAATEAGTVPPLPESGHTGRVPLLPENGAINAGTYLVPAAGFTALFEITAPDGWSSPDGDGLAKDDPVHPDEWGVFVGWWPAKYVPTDACAWLDALVEVGPSPQVFVDAMTAQKSTASSRPVEVRLGDYSGFEFDHSVEGNVDFAACDRGKFCIHSDLSNECTRWYSSAAERETYRVVDLNGQRGVIWVVQFHETINPELTKEARAVFDSIVFKSGG